MHRPYFGRRRLPAAAVVAVLLLNVVATSAAHAAVAVISNRTAGDIRFTVTGQGRNGQAGQPISYTVLSGDITVVPLRRGELARLAADSAAYLIDPDAAYFFGTLPSGKVDFVRIGIAELPTAEPAVVHSSTAAPRRSAADEEAARTITVKIFVDDDERANRSVWERRIRDRLSDCSEILARTCGMKISVISSGTWQLSNSVNDFDTAVNEFCRIDPGEAQLAIGFTARYQNPSGRMHMGGTHGPLDRHILVREWSRHFSESERLEFLLHELGHYLGAVHSPESDAVMRPQLGDRQSRSKRFQIHFDPLNVLAMNLVAEDMRTGQVRSVAELSTPTKTRLQAIYREIDKALPDDPAARQYLRILDAVTPRAVSVGLP